MITYLKGDLLTSDCDYICHQVNCQGRMGSGIAKQIKERWPEVYFEYGDRCYRNGANSLLGTIDILSVKDSGVKVINMYSQFNYGYDGKRYTSYDAFDKALHNIKNKVPAGSSIGFPNGIGCGLGGGDWRVIMAMISSVLGVGYDIYIYELEEGDSHVQH